MTNKTTNIKLDAKTKFEALQNAKHIFGFKEDKTKFKLLDVVNGEDNCKAVVVTEDGEIMGLFTDSRSAKSVLNDVFNVFKNEQPFIIIDVKETDDNKSVYRVEVQ